MLLLRSWSSITAILCTLRGLLCLQDESFIMIESRTNPFFHHSIHLSSTPRCLVPNVLCSFLSILSSQHILAVPITLHAVELSTQDNERLLEIATCLKCRVSSNVGLYGTAQIQPNRRKVETVERQTANKGIQVTGLFTFHCFESYLFRNVIVLMRKLRYFFIVSYSCFPSTNYRSLRRLS